MVPDREDAEGENMYNDRQRPFLLVSALLFNRSSGIPEVVGAVFVCYHYYGNLRIIFNGVYAA